MTKVEHPLSWNAILRVFTVGFIAYVLFFKLIDTVLIIIVSLMLASALYPLVKRLNKHLPLSVSAIIVSLALLLPLILILVSIVPGLISQFPDILNRVDTLFNSSSTLPESVRNLDFTQYYQNAASYLLRSTSVVTNILTTFITVFFLVIYLLIDSERLRQVALNVIPDKEERKLENMLLALSKINGQYIRGNLLISVICGIVVFIGLTLLKVPYAAPLALSAGILDLLPLIGAFVGAVPAILIAFTISPTTGILVIILFLVYQQFENAIVAPNVYDKALDVSPALSFIAVIIGTALLGIVGAFIALPIAAGIPTIIKYLNAHRS